MSLLAPWWLLGLAALVPLLLLHLRRRRRRVEVDSLLLWREQSGALPPRRRARLVPSLLLLLQGLVVVLLVLALARPSSGGGTPAAGAAPALFVLDDSPAMAATDVAPDRLTAARRQLDARLARLPAATPVTIVLAGSSPRLLVTAASPATARDAVADVRPAAPIAGGKDAAGTGAPAAGTADLRAGIALAAGQLHRPGGTITLLHARGTTPPPVESDGVAYAAVAIGTVALDDVALTDASARCAPPAPAAPPRSPSSTPAGDPATPSCTVFAAVRNDGRRTVRERLVVERAGDEIASRALTVAAGERVELAFAARAGDRLILRLATPDALAADDTATVVVPRPGALGDRAASSSGAGSGARPTTVALVSDRPATSPLARALAATPGVALRPIAPGAYDADAVARADLAVFDRWLPDGDLPAAPALLLVAPPRLPGGNVRGALAEPVVSGLAEDDPLLAGVDLDGLAIAAGAARRTALPGGLRALAWAPAGPLLVSGLIPGARPTPTTVLTFDIAGSTLPQLPAFPALLANVVAAARAAGSAADNANATATGAAATGAPATGAAATGAAATGAPATGAAATGATRPTASLDAGVRDAGARAHPLTIRAGDGGGPLPAPPRRWWPWLIALGLLTLLAEWSYPRWSGRREVRA